MFEIIPAVDIQQGRAVRLYEGDPERETVYFASPLDAARHWADLGAGRLHLVDLDAALDRGTNEGAIREIASALAVPLEVGGGIRSAEAARAWLEHVDRVVLGTAAVTRPEILDELLADHEPERIAVSIDARDGRVALRGWKETSEVAAVDLARQMAERGVRQLIYTDVSRDGTLRGVDEAPVAAVRDAFPHALVAGGGVARDEDLALYERLGLQGAIVGRALYEGTVTYPRTA